MLEGNVIWAVSPPRVKHLSPLCVTSTFNSLALRRWPPYLTLDSRVESILPYSIMT